MAIVVGTVYCLLSTLDSERSVLDITSSSDFSSSTATVTLVQYNTVDIQVKTWSSVTCPKKAG